MASMALISALQKLSSLGLAISRRSPWSSRALVTGASRPPQGNLGEDAQKSVTGAVGGELNKSSSEETRGIASASAAVIDEPEMETDEGMEQQTVESVIDQVATGVNSAAAGAKGVANDTINQMGETAETIGDKAKQFAQDAWGTAKETAEKMKDSVVGKAEDTKESVRGNAEAIKRAMSTKDR